jgi:hypothetical protein
MITVPGPQMPQMITVPGPQMTTDGADHHLLYGRR